MRERKRERKRERERGRERKTKPVDTRGEHSRLGAIMSTLVGRPSEGCM